MKSKTGKPGKNQRKSHEDNEDKVFVPTMAPLAEIVTDESIKNASFKELQRQVVEEEISTQWRDSGKKEKLSVTRGISYLYPGPEPR